VVECGAEQWRQCGWLIEVDVEIKMLETTGEKTGRRGIDPFIYTDRRDVQLVVVLSYG
jgi:hypothetical protein